MGNMVYHFPGWLVPPPQPADNGARAAVQSGIGVANDYAKDAFLQAMTFLDSILDAANQLENLPQINTELGAISALISPYTPPTVPTAPNTSANFGSAPQEPTIGTVTPLAIGPAPVFDAVPLALDLNIPLPTDLTATVPNAPELTTIVLPGTPEYILPDVPTLLGVTIPTAPTLTLPTFDAVAPTAPNAPDVGTFTFTEPAFSDALFDATKAKLLSIVQDPEGYTAEIEQAIWDRARAREIDTMRSAEQNTMIQQASFGFPIPAGALRVMLENGFQNELNKVSTLSRDIAIENAKLTLEFLHKAITEAIQFEGQWLDYSNKVAQRAFDAAKAVIDVAISLYNAQISGYNAEIQVFVARASVFKTLIEAEVTKLEVFKTELEAQKVIGELNLQNVQIYKTKVDALGATIELYKAQIEGAKALSEMDKNKVGVFAAQVDAYNSQVAAKASEYDAYATRIKGEATKVEVFKSQADAYDSVVNGYSALVTANVAQQNAQIKAEIEVPLEVYKNRLDAYKTSVSAESERLKALTDVFNSNIQLYAANVDGEKVRLSSELDQYRTEVEVKAKEADLRLQNARANLESYVKSIELLIEAAKGGSVVAAQLAASALSAVNLSASLSDGVSNSASLNHSNSVTDMPVIFEKDD